MIRFDKVSKVYPPNSVALEDVSFSITDGEFVSLVGKSGAGKSTLLELFLREEFPSEGKVLFQGED
ncbi:MAG: ATP-binding cassette domain-containing protein, partial [bacterium]|nr:ATP-binding cassette domain-containing protein [bacterium]